MSRTRIALFPLLLAPLALAACGGDDDVSSVIVPTVTRTATATAVPATATSTVAPPTQTATAVPTDTQAPRATATAQPSATSTSTAEPTATSTVEATATATVEESGVTALFHANPLDPANPFPSDRLLDETGHVHVTAEVIGADLPPDVAYDTARTFAGIVADQLTQLTGFSTFAPMRVKLAAPIPVPAAGAVAVLNCETGEVPVRLETTTVETSGDNALEIYPVLPLRPKTTYVYVVTRAALDASGEPLAAAPELTQALDGQVPSLAAWRGSLNCALERLADEKGIAVEDIVAIDIFTTQPTTDDLLAIKNLFADGVLQPPVPVFENSPIPSFPVGIYPENTPEFANLTGSLTDANIAAVGVGSFASYDFRKNRSAFDPELVAGNATPGVNNLEFYVTIPKAPMPEGGYPIVIFGHGLGGSAFDAIGASRLFEDAPVMVIGISALSHGRRGMATNFFNLVDGFATRENFRQTVADMLQLELMIKNATVAPFDKVNHDRIHYFGVSLGGIMGTLFMGNDPNVRTGVLSVPGGGLPNIVQSTAIGGLLKPLISLTVRIPMTDPRFPAFLRRFTHLSQWVLDAGDPINTAAAILDPERSLPGVPVKRILMQVGITDDVVPNFTSEDLIATMGIDDAKATLGCNSPEGCTGVWRFVMTDYGFAANSGHGVTGTVPEARTQVKEYIVSDGTVITDASPAE